MTASGRAGDDSAGRDSDGNALSSGNGEGGGLSRRGRRRRAKRSGRPAGDPAATENAVSSNDGVSAFSGPATRPADGVPAGGPVADVPAEISHLDFAPSAARCECSRCPGHESRCAKAATMYVKVHALHECKHPELTVDGGAVQLVCSGCMFSRTRRAAEFSNKVAYHHACGGQTMRCASCGRELLDMSDLVEVRSVDEI